MSVEALEKELGRLDDAELRRVIACAVAIQQRREGVSIDDLSSALDDPNPERWISLPELGRRWGIEEDDAKK